MDQTFCLRACLSCVEFLCILPCFFKNAEYKESPEPTYEGGASGNECHGHEGHGNGDGNGNGDGDC